MKSISIFINICFVLFFIVWGCTTSPNAAMDNNKNTIQNYSGTQFDGLSKNLVHEMIDIYKSEISYSLYRPHGLTNPDMDSRSVWFNLDTIKKFIWHIETLAKTNGVSNLDKLGLRIYWGRYPANPPTWPLTYNDLQFTPQNYNKLHTAFMISTYNNGTYNVDFDPEYVQNSIPKSITYLYDSISNKFKIHVLNSVPESQNNSLQNHGTLIPPMQPSNYQGAELMKYADTH